MPVQIRVEDPKEIMAYLSSIQGALDANSYAIKRLEYYEARSILQFPNGSLCLCVYNFENRREELIFQMIAAPDFPDYNNWWTHQFTIRKPTKFLGLFKPNNYVAKIDLWAHALNIWNLFNSRYFMEESSKMIALDDRMRKLISGR